MAQTKMFLKLGPEMATIRSGRQKRGMKIIFDISKR